MKTIYLIRHAQSSPSHVDHIKFWPLSPLGKKQAEQLSRLLINFNLTQLYSSPYIRCINTILPFSNFSGLKIIERDGLREHMILTTIQDGFERVWKKTWTDFNYRPPGGETAYECQQRIIKELYNIANESPHNSSVGVCTHGNIIGLFMSSLKTSFSYAETISLRNPEIIALTYKNETFAHDVNFSCPDLEIICSPFEETPFHTSE